MAPTDACGYEEAPSNATALPFEMGPALSSDVVLQRALARPRLNQKACLTLLRAPFRMNVVCPSTQQMSWLMMAKAVESKLNRGLFPAIVAQRTRLVSKMLSCACACCSHSCSASPRPICCFFLSFCRMGLCQVLSRLIAGRLFSIWPQAEAFQMFQMPCGFCREAVRAQTRLIEKACGLYASFACFKF